MPFCYCCCCRNGRDHYRQNLVRAPLIEETSDKEYADTRPIIFVTTLVAVSSRAWITQRQGDIYLRIFVELS
jgi:hypothetical protein